MNEVSSLVLQISSVLSSIRLSMDPGSARRRLSDADLERVAKLVGDLENFRFKFTAFSRGLDRNTSQITLRDALFTLQISIGSVINDPNSFEFTKDFAFRLQPSTRDRIPTLSLIEPRIEISRNVAEIMLVLHGLLDRLARVDDYERFILEISHPAQMEFGDENNRATAIQVLKGIVPSQKIAPLQFKINNEKISIEDSGSQSHKDDQQNIHIAKSEILRNSDKIIHQLKTSNCDRRLIENIEQLHFQISTDANAVQVGISNISFSVMSGTFKSELPDAVSAMLQSHNLSIGMYVAQFPDWNRFSENANLANIGGRDADIVDENSKYVLEYLESHPEIADPQVVRAIRQLRKVIQNPGQATKRVIFAVIRTVENLLSKIFQYSIEFFEQTMAETSKTASKATAILIVTLALNAAVKLTPIAEKIGELSWLKNAIEIVQKQMKIIK